MWLLRNKCFCYPTNFNYFIKINNNKNSESSDKNYAKYN